MADLRDSLEWAAWTLERDQFRKERALADLLRILTSHDVASVVHLVEAATGEEREAALLLLLHLWRTNDPRLVKGPNAGLWRDALRRAVVREYPRPPLGPPSMQGLIECDPRAAEEFLTENLTLDGLSEEEAERVARHLGALGSARAVARLVAMEELGGNLGTPARKALDLLGLVDRGRIKALAEDWRRRKTADLLRSLYQLYVRHLPEGTPVADIIELLGEPDVRRPGSMSYRAEGRSLYLEVDNKDGVAGRGFD